MVDASKLSDFARDLKNIGVDIDTTLLEPPIENNQTIAGIQAQLWADVTNISLSSEQCEAVQIC